MTECLLLKIALIIIWCMLECLCAQMITLLHSSTCMCFWLAFLLVTIVTIITGAVNWVDLVGDILAILIKFP